MTLDPEGSGPGGTDPGSGDDWDASDRLRDRLADDREPAADSRDSIAERLSSSLARDDATSARVTERGARPEASAELQRLGDMERRLTWNVVLAMLAAVPDAVVAVDINGLIMYANEQAESLFGWSKADLLGQRVEVLVPEQLTGPHATLRSAFSRHPTTRPMTSGLDLSGRRRDGTTFAAEISLSATNAGAERWVLATIRDVTTSRTFERDLEAARLEAVQANAAKDVFLSRMSHELRTPLNAILGFGQLLAMDELSADHVECVAQIIRAGGHLLGLVDEVLDISQLAQGSMRLSLEPVTIGEVVDEVVSMLRPLAGRRGVDLAHSLSASVHVTADRQRLRQVITNLVTNAVKYNRDGGTVRIGGAAAPDDRFRLTVTDTGMGIAARDLGLLFTPFERLRSAEEHVEGTGLGLALAKRLVEAMDGEIGVSSRVGVGSSFWFELPGAAGLEAPPGDPLPAPPASDGPRDRAAKTILYIEDNSSNIRLLDRAIRRRPEVHLVVATDGRSGIELAFGQRPDLILLDLGLPDMSGDDVLRALRADTRTQATPIVVISADAMPNRPSELLALGAAAYITKPFDLARLLRLIDDVASSAGAGGATPDDPPATVDDGAKGEPDPPDPPHGDLLDAGQVRDLRRIYADQAGRHSFVDAYCIDTRSRVRSLAVAARAGDALAVSQGAHSLIGSCGLVGAHRVVALLAAMQAAAGTGACPDERQVAALERASDEASIAVVRALP